MSENLNNIEEKVTEITETPTEKEEQRSEPTEDMMVYGRAITYNVESCDLGGYKEIILPTAIDEDVIKRSDIKFLYEHSATNFPPLARCKYGEGTLGIELRSDGVYYNFKCENKDIYNAIKRKDVDEASFNFVVKKSDETWKKNTDGTWKKYVNKISELRDLSLVNSAAYKASYSAARSADNKVDETYYDDYKKRIEKLMNIN